MGCHTDIREELHTGGGEGKQDHWKVFNSSLHALYSAVDDDNFLTLRTTDLKFQELSLHVEWPGSPDCRESSGETEALSKVCSVHASSTEPINQRSPGALERQLRVCNSILLGRNPRAVPTQTKVMHWASGELVTLQSPKRDPAPIFEFW